MRHVSIPNTPWQRVRGYDAMTWSAWNEDCFGFVVARMDPM